MSLAEYIDSSQQLRFSESTGMCEAAKLLVIAYNRLVELEEGSSDRGDWKSFVAKGRELQCVDMEAPSYRTPQMHHRWRSYHYARCAFFAELYAANPHLEPVEGHAYRHQNRDMERAVGGRVHDMLQQIAHEMDAPHVPGMMGRHHLTLEAATATASPAR